MRKHSFDEHTADVRLVVQGDSLGELFTAALEGMAELIKHDGCSRKGDQVETITLSAADSTSLLIDFLSEVLTRTHVNNVVYNIVDFSILNEKDLEATIKGCSVEAFDEDVKAVTYHEAEIKKNEESIFETVIVFDI